MVQGDNYPCNLFPRAFHCARCDVQHVYCAILNLSYPLSRDARSKEATEIDPNYPRVVQRDSDVSRQMRSRNGSVDPQFLLPAQGNPGTISVCILYPRRRFNSKQKALNLTSIRPALRREDSFRDGDGKHRESIESLTHDHPRYIAA